MQIETEFHHQVETWVADAVVNARCFDDLVASLPGVYPLDVAMALKRLFALGDVNRPQCKKLLADARSPLCNRYPAPTWPIVPHPLDYCWPFSAATAQRLSDEALKYSRAGGSVVLLGAPTLFRVMVDRSVHRVVLLLDSDPAVRGVIRKKVPNFEAIRCDVARDSLPARKAQVVIADSPWYETDMRCFLWVASAICDIGGTVLFSLPGYGTRPGVKRETERLLEWGTELGLSIVSIDERRLTYVSPPFELNALTAAGIKGVGPFWRRGSLAVFLKRESSRAARPTSYSGESWDEQIVGRVRIRIRDAAESHWEDPSLCEIVEGDILPSVSCRDPRRKSIDVWTSGNRVFSCKGRFVLGVIVAAIRQKVGATHLVSKSLGCTLSAAEAVTVERTAAKILDLVKSEETELDEGYYLSEDTLLGVVCNN